MGVYKIMFMFVFFRKLMIVFVCDINNIVVCDLSIVSNVYNFYRMNFVVV